jgi:hypothetical protein
LDAGEPESGNPIHWAHHADVNITPEVLNEALVAVLTATLAR